MKGMKAGPALDALVAERVMGNPWRKPTHGTCCTCQVCGHPNDSDCECGYSEYIERSWPVVEQLCKSGVEVQIHVDLLGTHVAVIDGEAVLADVTEKDAPYAICLAALRVKGVEL